MNMIGIGVNGIQLTSGVGDDSGDVFLNSDPIFFFDKRKAIFGDKDVMDIKIVIFYLHDKRVLEINQI